MLETVPIFYTSSLNIGPSSLLRDVVAQSCHVWCVPTSWHRGSV